MMKETSGYFNSAQNKQLFYRLFQPNTDEIIGTLLILHGMQEHSGRYIDFAKYLCNQGYIVMCYDHLGHGKTVNNQEELGFFKLGNPAQQLIDDAEEIFKKFELLFPDYPHYILGHSMGSFILRLLLQRIGDRVDGAIIVGTGDKNPIGGIAKGLLCVMNMLMPKRRSKLVNMAFEKMNNSKFKDEPDASSTSWLSVSKSNREAFSADILNGVPFSNNGFYALLTLNINATKAGWYRPINNSLPLLFVSGGDDPIGNFGKGVQNITRILSKEGFADVSLKLYDGMRHEIMNEDIKKQVYHDILTWLSEHIHTSHI